MAFKTKQRLRGVRDIFGPYHAESTRSDAAFEYVWKDDTRVAGTQFELGQRPVRRANGEDMARVVVAAKSGRWADVPPDILVRYYGNLRRISADFSEVHGNEKHVSVYWGATGTGKSRRAWTEYPDAYSKDPLTKFWCGYQAQQTVIIDEFRGVISIAHMLRWLDRYPVRVEVKGSSVGLAATRIIITSNLDPRNWYPDLDAETLAALMRRFTVVEHFVNLMNP